MMPPRICRQLPPFEQRLQTANLDYRRAQAAPLCYQTRELPGVDNIRLRLLRIAMENGLRGVSDDVAAVLGQALEYYLKNVIGNCIFKIRPHLSDGNFRYAANFDKSTEMPPLTSKDFMFSFETSPYVLGDLYHTMESVRARMMDTSR